ncbi:MAG TPA: alkaline phosphatase family protein [Bacteroidales bacterium]|nr:alkaline phosphatase family protein [Bacteroidales bacterium]
MKKITLFLFALIIYSLFIQSVYAENNSTIVNIDSPYQVKPGTSLPIYITIYHIGDIQKDEYFSENDILASIQSLEVKSQSDTINIDSIEIYEPVINDGISEQSLSYNQPQIITINQPNIRLNSIGEILQLQKNIESFTPENSLYVDKDAMEIQNQEEVLQNLIQKEKYRNITLLKFADNFPEGNVEIPIKITYSREKMGVLTQESVSKTLSVTVTSTIQPKRAIIIDIDALKRDAFENALPDMPTMKEIVDNGVQFTNATTVFPSVTLAAQASIFTGNYPKNHAITGNTWFDRSTKTYRKYHFNI